MNAIVNATPLIALARIDRLDLLRSLFNDVIVPDAVYTEVVARGARKPGAAALLRTPWLQVVPSPVSTPIEPFLTGLDIGEIAVLLLARQIKPDWVVIDERQARRVAFAMGLPVKGTLGILLAAAIAGLLTKQEAATDLERLLGVGIRISVRWQQWLRDELQEL